MASEKGPCSVTCDCGVYVTLKRIEFSTLGEIKCNFESLQTLGRTSTSGFSWNPYWFLSQCWDETDTYTVSEWLGWVFAGESVWTRTARGVFWETSTCALVRFWLWLGVRFNFYRLNTSLNYEGSLWLSSMTLTRESWALDRDYWTWGVGSVGLAFLFFEGPVPLIIMLVGVFLIAKDLTLSGLGYGSWTSIDWGALVGKSDMGKYHL